MRLLHPVILAGAVLAATACDTADDTPSCLGGKCDDLGLTSRLDGRHDAIAELLRARSVGEDGVQKIDYGELVTALAAQQGCGADSWRTFVLSDHLLEGVPFPRLIATVCSTDATRASEIFIAASFKDPDADDIDAHNVEAFAWDASAATYRFYAAPPEGDDSIKWDVEPERCAKCHLTPKGLPSDGMGMTPIMNELTQPWAHWNSQVPMFNMAGNPFPSHSFEILGDVPNAPNFKRFARDHAGAATEFEQIIRAGHARVTGERVRARREVAVDWRPAMSLLRPLFCDEQVNYTTEDFGTGLLNVTSVVPGGVREAYRAIRTEPWPWQWVNNPDARIRLPVAQTIPPLFMFPIRGSVDVEYESRMMGVRAIDPMQILRVRALDWKRPVLSDLRCGLWTRAMERFETEPPALDLTARVVNHLPVLFDAIMQVGGVSLLTGDPSTMIVLDQAATRSQTAMAANVEAAKAGAACAPGVACVVGVEAFGSMLDAHVASFESGQGDAARERLLPLRDESLCAVSKAFENAPALPQIFCR